MITLTIHFKEDSGNCSLNTSGCLSVVNAPTTLEVIAVRKAQEAVDAMMMEVIAHREELSLSPDEDDNPAMRALIRELASDVSGRTKP